MTITTNRPFPFNFRNVANVGDKIRAEILPAEEGQPAMFLIGAVIEKDASCFRVAIISTAGAWGLWTGGEARIPYGILSDWADRVTLVERAPVSAELVRKALDGAKQMIDGMLTRDEILQREIDELKRERDLLCEQLATSAAVRDSLQRDLGIAQRQLTSERCFMQGQLEKAQADYRDLRLRMLEVNTNL